MERGRKAGIDYRALAGFRYEIRRFLNFSERAAREAGIEPHQHQALLAIKGRATGSGATVGGLAESLQIQHHTAVELSDRLEAKGLVRRVRDRDDRRTVHLCLTRRGEALLRRLSLSHRNELRSAAPKLIGALTAVMESASSKARRKK